MGLRDVLNDKPIVAVVTIVVLVAGAIALTIPGIKTTKVDKGSHPGRYYSADEGQTWIADDWALVPPFERDGKTYVRVFFWSYDAKTPAGGFLEKFTPEAQSEINAIESAWERRPRVSSAGPHDLLVKKFGEGDWVPRDSAEGEAIAAPPPANEKGEPRPLVPQL